MSDKKISQLPASTTPLAGTEELAIVQSGDTKKVTVNNLTDGKDVSALNITVSSKAVVGQLGVNTTTPKSAAEIYEAGSGSKTLLRLRSGPTSGDVQYLAFDGSENSTRARIGSAIIGGGHGELVFETRDPSTGVLTERGRFKAAGNLAFPSGQGIDFSADGSAAGMTSELLDDYEEGTFTPVLSDSSGNNATAGFSGGVYTKIGRVISFQLNIININTAGLTAGDAIRVSLPFASFAGQYGSTSVRVSVIAFTTLPVGYITPNAAYLNLFEASSGAAGANVLVSALTNGQSDIMISGTYQTN